MNVQKVLRYGLYIGIFATPFIPLIIANGLFFPFITGKNFTFRILVELMLGGWVLLMLLDARYRPRFSWVLATLIAFVAVIGLANIFAENPFKAFWSNFERMDGWVTLIHLLGYFLVLSTVLNAERLWERFLQTSVGASVLISCFGLLQLAGVFTINQGGDRLDATFGNAIYLAVYMLFHIFITAFLIVRWRGEKYMYWVYGAIIALQTVILFFTATRGTVLGLIGGVLLTSLLIVFFGTYRKEIKRGAVGAIIGVIIVIGGFIAIKDTALVQNNYTLGRFADINLEAGQARFMVWNAAWQGFQERPVLGWGQDGFNFVFNKYYDPQMYDQETWFDRVHNIVFDWLVAGGILGALAYFSVPVAILYYLWFYRRDDPAFTIGERSVITGMLAAYFFHNLFVFDNLVSYMYYIVVLAFVHSRTAQYQQASSEFRSLVNPSMVKTVVAPIVIVFIATTIYFVNIPGIATAQTLIQALRPQESLDKNLEYFKEALEYNSVGRQEVREQFLQATSQLRAAEIPDEVKSQFLNEAYVAMQEEIDRVPNDARLNFLMSVTLSHYGLHDLALPYIERAVELSPDKQVNLFKLGEYYINTGQKEKALETFRMTWELAPEFDDARILYALAAVHNDRTELVQEILVPRFGTVAVDDDRLLNGYAKFGYANAVLEIWKTRVEKDPESAKKRISLAAAYAGVGDRVSAIASLEKAVEIDPSLRELVDKYIEQVRSGQL